MKKGNPIIYLLAFVLLVSACTGTHKTAQSSLTRLNSYSEGKLSYKSQFRFKYLFFESQRLKALEDYPKAVGLMEQCVAIDPLNADANLELSILHTITENLTSALFYANMAFKLNPDNTWILLHLAQVNVALGNLQGELNAHLSLVKLEPSNLDFKYSLAQSYTRNNLFKKAIGVYETIEDRLGVSQEVSVVKERLYIALGDLKSAVKELQILIDHFPANLSYRGMLAELYQANNMNEEALQVYTNILNENPSDPNSNIALAEHYRLKNDLNKAFKYLNYCFDNPSFSREIKFQILLSYFELATSDSSYLALLEPLLDKALFYHPNDPSFHGLSGDLYYQSNQMDLAYKSYLKALDFGESDYFIWNRCLLIGLELQLYKEVIDLGDRAIQLNPIQPMLYLLTGLAYSIDTRYDNAILVLNKGLKYVVNNKPLRAEFFSYLGDAYHSLALHKLSDDSYEKSLTLQPENHVVLNNYSYYLSLREVNLEKAEQLSKACNELRPDQANYQDTYGWILYKLGMHSKSLEWLRDALLNSNSASFVIMEHYADALYQNGLKEEAVQFWRKAISLGGDSPLLLKKAKDEALYE